MCETCRALLSSGLNLCVRARDMDARDRRASMLSVSKDPAGWKNGGRFDDFVERYNITNQDAPLHPRSATAHVWMIEQYERDLAEWEEKTRAHLLQCDASEFKPIPFPKGHAP